MTPHQIRSAMEARIHNIIESAITTARAEAAASATLDMASMWLTHAQGLAFDRPDDEAVAAHLAQAEHTYKIAEAQWRAARGDTP